MCACVRERKRGKHLHLQFLFGRSSAPGKQCLVLSLVFYVPSELRAQAGLCGREVAGLTPERPMQLFTTAGRVRVCVREGARVCVCYTVSGYMRLGRANVHACHWRICVRSTGSRRRYHRDRFRSDQSRVCVCTSARGRCALWPEMSPEMHLSPAFMSHLLRTFHPFARPPVPLTAARRPLTPGVCRM